MKAVNTIWIKGWLFAILLLLATIKIQAQSIRYSEHYDFDNGAGAFLSIVPLEDGRLLAQGTNFKNSVRQSYTVLIDSFGNLLDDHAIYGDLIGYESFAMIRLSTGQVVSAGSLCDYNEPSPGYCDFYFSRLDETGDTLFMKVYERPDTCDVLI
ncbi:MAG: hypothetical protein JKX84_11750, partial [Flavobacteriales bacterium]|nr:hypothetical protein [Flavobacteriales bacterium]